MVLSEFVINSLPVGGGELAITPIPGRTRHYYTDWLHLIDWRPALVISMTAQAELDRKGAGTLGTDLVNEGVTWWHCPVPDFNVPDGTWDWDAVRADALATLGRGERVLVHCFGGCGRSGMMCLRLMIAAGEEPDAALARLRETRPCAVETPAQLAWAQQG
ncbi:protein-tyrosine phosphatase family protein [Cognatiyoonia sp. IB215182]|uniref:phosphatase domain-containing protein n=1 Tax=Cognatiyoonia sp. IB215182 TaxID=3097353 RepID=UPI002A0C2864|nr:protein-tyrosine phosphatase family protein [Cognatiyoonia sp. IB215182]MDX8351564.1 protein-tyrosine phosphatase family protein [Cognatiyoonia sp. IB215182]